MTTQPEANVSETKPYVQHDDLCVWWDNVGKEPLDYACTCGRWADYLDQTVSALIRAGDVARERAGRIAALETKLTAERELSRRLVEALETVRSYNLPHFDAHCLCNPHKPNTCLYCKAREALAAYRAAHPEEQK